jgi:hypothetical protein
MKIIMFQWSSDAKPLLRNDSEEMLPGRTSGFLPFRIRLFKIQMQYGFHTVVLW